MDNIKYEQSLSSCIDYQRFLDFLFGLVSLFNGISTFIGYLMPKLFS